MGCLGRAVATRQQPPTVTAAPAVTQLATSAQHAPEPAPNDSAGIFPVAGRVVDPDGKPVNQAAIYVNPYRFNVSDDRKDTTIRAFQSGRVAATLSERSPRHSRPTEPLWPVSAATATPRLWNVNTGELLDVLNGHAPGLHYVAFAAQGRILAAAGLFDNDIRIWQLSVAPQGEKLDLANVHVAGRSVVVDSAHFPNPIVPRAQVR